MLNCKRSTSSVLIFLTNMHPRHFSLKQPKDQPIKIPLFSTALFAPRPAKGSARYDLPGADLTQPKLSLRSTSMLLFDLVPEIWVGNSLLFLFFFLSFFFFFLVLRGCNIEMIICQMSAFELKLGKWEKMLIANQFLW